MGSIVVPRMSGNFHISCHGSHAYVLPSEINVSHDVHSLSFGETLPPYAKELVHAMGVDRTGQPIEIDSPVPDFGCATGLINSI